LRIGIVGCGIAGQAAAIALARAGHDVTIVERFPQARPVGAGLLLQPSGQQALKRLGLHSEASHWGAPIARLHGQTAGGRMVMDLRYGDLGADVHGLGIHRSALFKVLHDALLGTTARICLGFDVATVSPTSLPFLVAHNGSREGPFDLVLDCAGSHDVLRDAFGGRSGAPLYPWGALWTTCSDRTGNFSAELQQRYRGANTMIGILPVGRVPGAHDDARHVAFFWSVKLSEFESLRSAGLASLKARVLSIWPEAAPILDEIESFDALSLATYRDVHLRPWRAGRVMALGDAAHGTSPQLGQGANLALIDAAILAYALEQTPDIDDALCHYERLRRSHVRFYQMASRTLTPFFQSDSWILGAARDLALGPLGKMPIVDHIMRTTLSGVRRFPIGLFEMPPP
jgi:2-polyprenyl-6-methoxyphenol hydroxylase-like FAD-dependent oxidoreductase